MRNLIFHVGMGKTGSTAIQYALEANASVLAGSSHAYLGSWMGAVNPAFDHFAGFQNFLEQSPEDLLASARTLTEVIDARSRATGVETFILSNEQYLENIARLTGFFRILAQTFRLKIIIFVRPPASWLPSAYVQWGVVHKTNEGPIQPFAVKARELIHQYGFVRQWRETFGAAVSLIPFDSHTDAVQSFAAALGVPMVSGAERHQVRPGLSEIVLRAAFNNAHPDMILPEAFDALREKTPADTPTSLSAKLRQVLDYDSIPLILQENAETLSYLEREFGLYLTGSAAPAPPAVVTQTLVDEVLGVMIDVVFGQVRQIAELTARLDDLERKTGHQDRTTQ